MDGWNQQLTCGRLLNIRIKILGQHIDIVNCWSKCVITIKRLIVTSELIDPKSFINFEGWLKTCWGQSKWLFQW